ncbi:MAG: hypothetical protein AAB214_21360 [Fibrobacterota bacterium]
MTLRKKQPTSPESDGWARGPGRRQASPSGHQHPVLAWIEACAQGKLWWPRVPLLAWMIWVWVQHTTTDQYQSLAKGLNLGIHELGHMVFAPLGQFMSVAGGTLLQCLVPILGMFMFVRQRDAFAVFFGFGWLGTNFFEVADYVADARTMELQLVSPFAGGDDEITHDWNWLLSHTGLLAQDQGLAGLIRFAGHMSFAVCVAGGVWTLWRMGRYGTLVRNPI